MIIIIASLEKDMGTVIALQPAQRGERLANRLELLEIQGRVIMLCERFIENIEQAGQYSLQCHYSQDYHEIVGEMAKLQHYQCPQSKIDLAALGVNMSYLEVQQERCRKLLVTLPFKHDGWGQYEI